MPRSQPKRRRRSVKRSRRKNSRSRRKLSRSRKRVQRRYRNDGVTGIIEPDTTSDIHSFLTQTELRNLSLTDRYNIELFNQFISLRDIILNRDYSWEYYTDVNFRNRINTILNYRNIDKKLYLDLSNRNLPNINPDILTNKLYSLISA
jgi:hypothetical protein